MRTDTDEAVAFHNFANAPNKTLRHAPSGVAPLSARFISQDPLFSGSGLPGQQAYHTCKIKSTVDTACPCFNCV